MVVEERIDTFALADRPVLYCLKLHIYIFIPLLDVRSYPPKDSPTHPVMASDCGRAGRRRYRVRGGLDPCAGGAGPDLAAERASAAAVLSRL